jgi:ABC-2 type transport system permease protein
VSVPNRLLVLAGKATAYLVIAVAAAALTVAAAFVAAHLALDQPASAGTNLGAMMGAVAYLVLVGLFAAAMATIARHLVAALVVMCALVLVVSPFLRTITTLASYLPDSAGMQLYQAERAMDGGLTPLQGAAVLATWLALAHLIAAAAFIKRDA